MCNRIHKSWTWTDIVASSVSQFIMGLTRSGIGGLWQISDWGADLESQIIGQFYMRVRKYGRVKIIPCILLEVELWKGGIFYPANHQVTRLPWANRWHIKRGDQPEENHPCKLSDCVWNKEGLNEWFLKASCFCNEGGASVETAGYINSGTGNNHGWAKNEGSGRSRGRRRYW